MKHFSSRAISLLGLLLCFSLSASSKDPADYPLKVHILQQSWASRNLVRGVYRGEGRGNIWDAAGLVHGFDYTYDCSFPLARTARNQSYPAKWSKPQLRLTILAGEIGKTDKYSECTLKTTVRDGVYILAGGVISEMSQEDYKAGKAKMTAAQTMQQDGTKTPSVVSKLSVTSAPSSAEIEIDGEFMGNTPSVLEVNPGEHSIAVRKAGYKTWGKKVKLAPGEITLNAELAQENTK